jgi:hypothetical protein
LWFLIEFVPHEAVSLSLLITQVIAFIWILMRLWQRASETLWYQQNVPVVAVAYTEPSLGADAPIVEMGSPEPPAGAPDPGDVPLTHA